MAQFAVGTRIVIRYQLPDGSAADALGQVAAADDDHVTVTTRRGDVRVPLAAVLLSHEVPPPPQRRGSAHKSIGAHDLQRILASTWVPDESAWLHRDNAAAEAEGADPTVHAGWLLRAHSGVTKRANSAVLFDDPQLDADAALAALDSWYTERGLAPATSLFSQTGDDDPRDSETDARLDALGFEIVAPVVVATAATAEVSGGATSAAQLAEPHLRFAVSEELPPAFLNVLAGSASPEEREARARLLASAPAQYFLAAFGVHPDGSSTLVGVARVAVSSKWAVLSNLTVHPEMRRRGAGRALTKAAAAHALGLGLRSMALQVEADNVPAATLYAQLGFAKHHLQHYRIRRG